jgi:predicted N-acetyltransferase YhbS
MTDNRIRVARADDARRFLETDLTVWFSEVSSAPVEQQLVGLHEDQRFAAYPDPARAEISEDTYAGVYGVFPMTLAVPATGGAPTALPCAGLTFVGVHPDHRRRGILTSMLRHHFEQVHETPGTHVSALHASEPAIYGRHGYGLASLELEVSLAPGTTLLAPQLEDAAAGVRTHLVTATDAGVPERLRACHLAHAGLGVVVGDTDYYERVTHPLPESLRDKEPWRVLFARRDGEDVGFAAFQRSHRWEHGRPAGELAVWTVAGEPATRLALLRRLLDLDLIGTVRIGTLGADDPLLHWVAGPRAAAKVVTTDNLWVRLVDLPEALEHRSWGAPCAVAVDVADRSAPWNAGTWRVEADASGSASVTRTSADPEVSLDVALLGAAYLGGGNLVAAHRAGLVTEHRPGAVAELWRGLRTDVAPSGAVMF